MSKKKLLEDSGLLPLWRLNTPPVPGSASHNAGAFPTPPSTGERRQPVKTLPASDGSPSSSAPSFAAITLPDVNTASQARQPASAPELPLSESQTDNHLAPPRPQLTDIPEWDQLETKVRNCRNCDLCLTRNKTVFGVGDRRPAWLFVGEGPGAEEDLKGEPFVGQAGRLLDLIFAAMGMSRQQGIYIANAVKCRPPNNRKPFPREMDTCFPYLEQQIRWLSPKIIVALGATGAQALLQCDTKIGALRGKRHTYCGIPVIATYHPAYLLRSPQEKAKVWADLVFAQRIYRQELAKNPLRSD